MTLFSLNLISLPFFLSLLPFLRGIMYIFMLKIEDFSLAVGTEGLKKEHHSICK